MVVAGNQKTKTSKLPVSEMAVQMNNNGNNKTNGEQVGWSHVPREQIGGALGFEEGLKEARQRDLLYSGDIAESLMEAMQRFSTGNNEAMDLGSEMAVLRAIVAREVALLTAAYSRPSDDIKKLATIDYCTERVQKSVREVVTTARAMASIKAQTQGKIDVVMLNGIVTAVSRSVDAGIQHFSGDIKRGGTNPEELSTYISGLLGQAVQEAVPDAPLSLTGSNPLERPTTLTSDMLVQAMDTIHMEAEEDVLLGGALAREFEEAEFGSKAS